MWPEPGNIGKHSLVKFKPTTKKLVKSQGDKKQKSNRQYGSKKATSSSNIIKIDESLKMKNSQ